MDDGRVLGFHARAPDELVEGLEVAGRVQARLAADRVLPRPLLSPPRAGELHDLVLLFDHHGVRSCLSTACSM